MPQENSNILAPIFRWASWGISDDIFSGIKDSYVSSKNINIRDNSKGISLNKALVLDSWVVVTEKINEIIKISNLDILAFGNSWGIYRKTWGTWVKASTQTANAAIVSATEFNGYIYWATTVWLFRLLTTSISSSFTTPTVFQALNDAPKHPLLASTINMYVGDGKSIWQVDIGNVYTTIMTRDKNSIIEDMDELGSNINILTKTNLWDHKIQLWNITQKDISQVIPLRGSWVKHTIIHNGYTYVFTKKGIGILDWYKIVLLKETDKINSNLSSIVKFDDKIYVWGTWGVYVFGAKNKNYVDVLSCDYSTSNGNSADEVWAIFSDGTDLYVSWSNGSSYGIDKLSTTVYYSSWELITRAYIAEELVNIKESLLTFLWFKKLTIGDKITLYYSIDWDTYTKIIDITSTTNTKTLFNEWLFVNGMFQYMQFKIVLESNWTKTPEFYNLVLQFNNNSMW